MEETPVVWWRCENGSEVAVLVVWTDHGGTIHGRRCSWCRRIMVDRIRSGGARDVMCADDVRSDRLRG